MKVVYNQFVLSFMVLAIVQFHKMICWGWGGVGGDKQLFNNPSVCNSDQHDSHIVRAPISDGVACDPVARGLKPKRDWVNRFFIRCPWGRRETKRS